MQWQYCGFSMLDDNALSAHKDVAEPILDDADSYKKHKKKTHICFLLCCLPLPNQTFSYEVAIYQKMVRYLLIIQYKIIGVSIGRGCTIRSVYIATSKKS